MPVGAGKLRILIPTTNGPAEVLLLTEEDQVIGRSVACIGGTTETADIAAAYHAFVARPTGVIERLFGHPCYRLDVSSRIDAGSSWQLGVLAAHALHAVGRLAQEEDVADGIVWATGSVRTVDLTVGGVSHVEQKLASSIERLKREANSGRAVLVAIPAQNAEALTPDVRADLDACGIAVSELSDTRALWDALHVKLPEAVPATLRPQGETVSPHQTTKRWRVWAAAAAVACVALGLGALYPLMRAPAPFAHGDSQPPPVSDQPAPPPQKKAELLVPETVPFVSDRDRVTIRAVYLPAPDFKAIALSSHTMGFSTDQSDEETARKAAMAACQREMERKRVRSRCELYAVGTRVIPSRGRPPMPPLPWIMHNPAVETPFDAKSIPLLSEASRKVVQRQYSKLRNLKAISISTTGFYSIYPSQISTDEAIRRALERCGSNSGVACMVLAVNNVFVVPLPRSMKVVGIFQPNAASPIALELREEVARRLATAASGWNAVAVGASGNVGMKLDAETEQAAIDAAIADCGIHDRACRIAVIGPFLVDGGARTIPTPAAAAHAAELIATLARAVPGLSALAREDLAQQYESMRGHKALAVVSGTNLHWRSQGWETSEAAVEGTFERCQVAHGTPCMVVVIDDKPQAASADGTWPARDMARARYAGTFDPDRIPGVFPEVRVQSDVLGYRNARGPKAAAYHPWGRIFIVLSADTQNAAETQALSKCNADPTREGRGGACHLYAIGDQVVLPRRLIMPSTP